MSVGQEVQTQIHLLQSVFFVHFIALKIHSLITLLGMSV